jgi:hypothetical protein
MMEREEEREVEKEGGNGRKEERGEKRVGETVTVETWRSECRSFT